MTIIYFLIGISVLLAGGFLYAFFWTMRSGQNDDTYTPGIRILFEDEPIQAKSDEDHISSK